MLSARPIALNADTRTPGRALKGRSTLQENVYRGSMTISVKGKGALTPHRPLASRPHKTSKDQGQPTVSRPLGDKTPFPNRVANLVPFCPPEPLTGKLAKLSLLDAPPTLATITPGALLRPSSARKSLRSPRLSDSGGRAFELRTPVTQGNHWDVSDGDVDLGQHVSVEETEAVQEEDYDEIEYMPPAATFPPYEPPFEMPNYKIAGRALLELAHSAKFDDTADLYCAQDIEVDIDPREVWNMSGFVASPLDWERVELPELENDSPLPRKATSTNSAAKLCKPQARTHVSSSTAAHRPTAAARSVPSVRLQGTSQPIQMSTRSTGNSASGFTTRQAARSSTNASSNGGNGAKQSAPSTRSSARSTASTNVRSTTASGTRGAGTTKPVQSLVHARLSANAITPATRAATARKANVTVSSVPPAASTSVVGRRTPVVVGSTIRNTKTVRSASVETTRSRPVPKAKTSGPSVNALSMAALEETEPLDGGLVIMFDDICSDGFEEDFVFNI
ncbi:uncharacterized protein FIBRA_00193 [Fibroporia radiculosa]|uniref:Uncharacterized protein n=1 Tax=Fibroporia radiculosa TaxID=599839 RepID=J7S5S9_9APHY|nr:uncharacterized protein FIBRA_00193 [Fibroporia radiculosa]CCL98199.1 predicted protein [Fibroporia radiculosa]